MPPRTPNGIGGNRMTLLLTIVASITEATAATCIWAWRRPVLLAPVWVPCLVALAPLHVAPELLDAIRRPTRQAPTKKGTH